MKHLLETYLVLFFGFCLQATGQKIAMENDSIVLDSGITYGQLENGLSYYIKNLPESESPIALRLFVKAGISYQTDKELEVAHFLEHLAFKKSKHFPEGIYNYLEHSKKEGMSRFAINGHTGAFHTEYIFDAPFGNSQALKTGLLWFNDIAKNLSLATEDINTERGVIVQETILRSADNFDEIYYKNQIAAKLFPCYQDATDFFQHMKSLDPEIIRKFYHKWYQPQSMAIAVVGHIPDSLKIETTIKTLFSDIPVNKQSTSPPNCDSVFFNRTPQFAFIEKSNDTLKMDKEVLLNLLYRDPVLAQNSLKNNALKIRKEEPLLFVDILNKRFQEATEKYNSSYKITADHTLRSRQQPSALKIEIRSTPEKDLEALKDAVTIINQIIQGGVYDIEFENAKVEHLKNIENISPNSSRYWVENVKQNFIYNVPFNRNSKEEEIQRLEGLSLKKFNGFLLSLNFKMPDDIAVLVPNNYKGLLNSEKPMRSLIREILAEPVTEYKLPLSPDYLMGAKEAARLKQKRYVNIENSEENTREVVLENGVKVVMKSLKPTPGGYEDKIYIHGFKTEGAYNVKDEDYFSAINAPEIIKNAGVGRLDKFEFKRFIAGNSLWWYGIKPYIRNLESGIEIDSNPKDLEIMLQVIYLLLSKPVINDNAFSDWRMKEIKNEDNPNLDSKNGDLNTGVARIIDDHSGSTYGSARFNGLNQVDKEKAFHIFNQLLGNAKGLNFIITGDFSIHKSLPLINKYLGNLPLQNDLSMPDICQYPGLNSPAGPLKVRFKLPNNSKKDNILLKLLYMQQATNGKAWKEILKVKALGAVIDNKVWGLRFDKGYSLYTLGAIGKFNRVTNRYSIESNFDCFPKDLQALKKEFEDITDSLKEHLISSVTLNQSLKRLKFLNDDKGRGGSNKSVNDKLYDHYRFGTPLVNNMEILNFINSITPEDIRATARKYLVEENYYEFVMAPGKSEF